METENVVPGTGPAPRPVDILRAPERCGKCDGKLVFLNKSRQFICTWCESEYSERGEIVVENYTPSKIQKAEAAKK